MSSTSGVGRIGIRSLNGIFIRTMYPLRSDAAKDGRWPAREDSSYPPARRRTVQETILYSIVAITVGAFFIPAVGVLVQVAREATRADWLEAIPGIGLLLFLSIMPIDLDWGTAGTMFFVLLLIRSRKNSLNNWESK